MAYQRPHTKQRHDEQPCKVPDLDGLAICAVPAGIDRLSKGNRAWREGCHSDQPGLPASLGAELLEVDGEVKDSPVQQYGAEESVDEDDYCSSVPEKPQRDHRLVYPASVFKNDECDQATEAKDKCEDDSR